MSKREREQHLQKMVQATHFDYDEVKLLQEIYGMIHTVKASGVDYLSRPAFRDILILCFDMVDDMMMDRTYHSLASQGEYDASVSVDLWVTGMSVYLRGTIEEKIDFCFRVYDIDMNQEISRDEMYSLLSESIVKSPSEEDKDEAIRDLIEIVLKKIDVSTPKTQTSKISKDDFAASVKKNKLLLEVFGRCLPTAQQAKDFVTLRMRSLIQEKFSDKY